MHGNYKLPVARIWSLVHSDCDARVSDMAFFTAYGNHLNKRGSIESRLNIIEGSLEPLVLLVPNAVRFIEVRNVRYLLGPDLARLVKRAFLALDFCANHMGAAYREGLGGHEQVENPTVNMYIQGGLFSSDAQSQDEQSLMRELRAALKLLPVKAVDDVNEIDEFAKYEDVIKYSLPLCTQIALVTSERIEPLRMSLMGDDYCLLPTLFRILRTAMSNVKEHLANEVAVSIYKAAQMYICSKDTAKTEYPVDHIMRFLCTDMVPFSTSADIHAHYFGAIDNYDLQGEATLWDKHAIHVRPFTQRATEFELMLAFSGADGGHVMKAYMDQASKTDQTLMEVMLKYSKNTAVHRGIARGMGQHNYIERTAFNTLLAYTESVEPLPTVVRAIPTYTKADMGDKKEDETASMATVLILGGVVAALYLSW